jgi:hypothetical protein
VLFTVVVRPPPLSLSLVGHGRQALVFVIVVAGVVVAPHSVVASLSVAVVVIGGGVPVSSPGNAVPHLHPTSSARSGGWPLSSYPSTCNPPC